jgi:hypothetical protein
MSLDSHTVRGEDAVVVEAGVVENAIRLALSKSVSNVEVRSATVVAALEPGHAYAISSSWVGCGDRTHAAASAGETPCLLRRSALA